jgi:hypothetical protein
MAGFKKIQPTLKIYQVHSATFESGILENRDVLKRLYEIKKETGFKLVSLQLEHIKVKLLRQH